MRWITWKVWDRREAELLAEAWFRSFGGDPEDQKVSDEALTVFVHASQETRALGWLAGATAMMRMVQEVPGLLR